MKKASRFFLFVFAFSLFIGSPNVYATAPTVTPLGDGTTDYVLPSTCPSSLCDNGNIYGADLVFNVLLHVDSKIAIQTAIDQSASTQESFYFSWTDDTFSVLSMSSNKPIIFDNDVYSGIIYENIGGKVGDPSAQSLLLIDSSLNSAGDIIFSGGEGTQGAPFLIEDCQQLQNVNYYAEGGYYFILNNDINCSATTTWNEDPNNKGTYFGFMPIGQTEDESTYGVPFDGSFDGDNHTISGLYINRLTYNNVGLFGSVIGPGEEDAMIKNVNLLSVNITGNNQVGGLAGSTTQTHIENTITSGSVLGNNNIGGLVGYTAESPRTIINSHSDAEVDGIDSVGGLVGYNTQTNILNSYATGDVTGNLRVGGLVGYNNMGHIENTYATGNISGVTSVGGLVGSTLGNNPGIISTVINSYASGNVAGNSSVGGFVGYNNGDIIYNSYSLGRISSQGEKTGGILGGFIGRLDYELGDYNDLIINCGWYKSQNNLDLFGIGDNKNLGEVDVTYTVSSPTVFYSRNHEVYMESQEGGWVFGGDPWYEHGNGYPNFVSLEEEPEPEPEFEPIIFDWAGKFDGGENGYSYPSSIILDNEGNIYTTGEFDGTVDFDPSEGVYELTSSNNNHSSFISILANNGSFIGAYQLGNGDNNGVEAYSITLDEIGNIYTTGTFSGTVDFDPSEGVYELTSSSNSNGSSFISILANDGSFIGAYKIGDGENGYSNAYSITLDSEENIYTTGQFNGTVDFDPSDGVYELISSNNNESSFVSKLANDGSFIGAYQFENGENGYSSLNSTTLDNEENIYTTGSFRGSVDFDPSEGVYELTSSSNSNGSSFISILANDGSFIGAYKLDGENGYSYSTSITLDSEENIYMTGNFSGPVDFDPSEGVYELTSSNGYESSFISILANDGSFIEAYQLGDGENGYSYASSIILDNEGNIYTAGSFSGTVDFDPSEGIFELTSSIDDESSFISILANDGSFIGAYQLENGNSYVNSITLDNEGNIYTVGNFSDTVDFDPNDDIYELTANNENGFGFILKLIQQEQEPTPTRSRTRSTGSSVGVMSSFYQDQLNRAIATGIDTTPYIQALNQLPSTPNISTPNTIQRTLKYGMQGSDVKALQVYLNTHSYPVSSTGAGSLGNETNYFGLKTKQAVIKFQLANGLVGDGVVGPMTRVKLK